MEEENVVDNKDKTDDKEVENSLWLKEVTACKKQRQAIVGNHPKRKDKITCMESSILVLCGSAMVEELLCIFVSDTIKKTKAFSQSWKKCWDIQGAKLGDVPIPETFILKRHTTVIRR